MQRISIAGITDARRDAGFTLLEVVCVVAIVAMIAAFALPSMWSSTSQPRLKGYALQIATLLTADRNAAIRRGRTIATLVDAPQRAVQSGATGGQLRLPDDVAFSATLAARCNNRPTAAQIVFFASGLSCGGSLTLLRFGSGYDIRVNWLTGSVDIVPHRAT